MSESFAPTSKTALHGDLSEAIGGARSLVAVARTLPPHSERSGKAFYAELREAFASELRNLFHKVMELSVAVRGEFYKFLGSPDEEHTVRALDEALVFANLFAAKLDELAATTSSSDLQNLPDRLLDELEKIRGIAEDFRDIEETLALGRSEAFQQELRDAKRQAIS